MKKIKTYIAMALALILLALTLPIWLIWYAVNGFTPKDFFDTIHLTIKRVFGEEDEL